MLKIVPALLVTLVYVGFRVYGTRDRRLSKGLLMEAIAFALCSYVVMWVYRTYWLREGMSNYGDVCPNGYEMVQDPANPEQQTCLPVGHQTFPIKEGFLSKKHQKQ
jgi:hypothetical protein